MNIENEINVTIKNAVFCSVEDQVWSKIWSGCTFDVASSAHSRILHPTWDLLGATDLKGLQRAIGEIFKKYEFLGVQIA
jgi:hypothetical protein